MRIARVVALILFVLALSQAPVSATAQPPAAERDYFIIQFSGPILEEWKAQASASGFELLDYMSDFSFIARADRKSVEAAADLPFVVSVVDFPLEYKVCPTLLTGPAKVRVTIEAFQNEPISAVLQAVTREGGTVLAESRSERSLVRAEIPTKALAALSRVKEIAWIEPYIEPKLTNRMSRQITAVNPVWEDFGLYGAGQIVAVADTGLDNGQNNQTMSADFRGRIVAAYARARTNDWSDLHGHGTHVCGSVLGSGVLSGANPSNQDYTNSFAGMAPEAGLVIQSVADAQGGLSGLPTNLNDLFAQVYGTGARIHTNSWGSDVSGAYYADSRNVDMYMWNNKDMLILFAAGNAGIDGNKDGIVDLNSMNAPGSAKNCITVGATENQISERAFTYGAAWPSDYPADPIKSDLVADNPAGMAAFSSRGPCRDQRIKPDISAPGTNVISARSHMSGTSTLWGVYNSHYLYCGGTSMSTPIVAGAAAVLRQYLIEVENITNPSAALLKAALLNSATDTYPGQYGTGIYKEMPNLRPNNVQGWGRLNLRSALLPVAPMAIDYIEGPNMVTNNAHQYTYEVLSESIPFKATLVWTDYPGPTTMPHTRKRLVNDLDILVSAPVGQQYHGNGGTSPDRTNNVETVDILSPVAGTYTITVSSHNIPYGPQPYALVVSGGFGEEATIVSTIADAKAMPDDTLIGITGKVVTAGTEVLTDHFYIQEMDRTTGIKVSHTGSVPTAGIVSIEGTLASDGWERYIDATSVTVVSTGNPIPSPLGIRNSDIGGLGLGGRLGPENTGLLVRTWGEVVSTGADHVFIDDGYSPLKIWTGNLTKPEEGDYISVTGISSAEPGAPIVKARFADDIIVHQTEP